MTSLPNVTPELIALLDEIEEAEEAAAEAAAEESSD